jgi:hypothetical protein
MPGICTKYILKGSEYRFTTPDQWSYAHKNQVCGNSSGRGSGSARINIDLDLLDPDPHWHYGFGVRSGRCENVKNNTFSQCCESGFNGIRIRNLDPDPGGQKLPTNIEKQFCNKKIFVKNFQLYIFSSVFDHQNPRSGFTWNAGSGSVSESGFHESGSTALPFLTDSDP